MVSLSAPDAPAVRRARARQGVALALLGVATLVPADRVQSGPVICPFRALTGLPCPGCGLTRSFVFAMHGDPAAAVGAHLMGPLLVALCALWLVVPAARQVGSALDPQTWLRGRQLPVVLAVAAVWAAYAIHRLLVA